MDQFTRYRSNLLADTPILNGCTSMENLLLEDHILRIPHISMRSNAKGNTSLSQWAQPTLTSIIFFLLFDFRA